MHHMRSNKSGLLTRVLVGTIPSMDSVLPLCLNSAAAKFTANPLNTKAEDGDGDERESSFAPKSGGAEYGEVQEKSENVAEEMEKKWKLKEEENGDDMITFKDIGFDISKISHPDGDE
ncbi:hypothetical protein SUGI_1204720 [Cryptomeria japonica]|uniref:uncharacterized protein LOC131061374 n=1 Tax=Cryptomeria japonica TaxID=3369 RepID=UPI0024149C3D|nr:uncharacterized protein LOC131061374 [Cryptomeria japonica]GLJ56122.1 hypothetical protein SUGI_1204720 [Cryptomeria japonica]